MNEQYQRLMPTHVCYSVVSGSFWDLLFHLSLIFYLISPQTRYLTTHLLLELIWSCFSFDIVLTGFNQTVVAVSLFFTSDLYWECQKKATKNDNKKRLKINIYKRNLYLVKYFLYGGNCYLVLLTILPFNSSKSDNCN